MEERSYRELNVQFLVFVGRLVFGRSGGVSLQKNSILCSFFLVGIFHSFPISSLEIELQTALVVEDL